MQKIKDVILSIIYNVLAKLITFTPVSRLLPCADLVGNLLSLPRNAGQRYRERVQRLLPDVEYNIGRRFIANQSRFFCERMKYPEFVEEIGLEQYYQIEGAGHLDRALSEGKGVVLASTHFGALETGFLLLARKGYKITVVRAVYGANDTVNTPGLERLRRKIKVEMIDRTPMRTIFYRPGKSYRQLFTQVLEQNEILLILPDAGHGRHFEDVPFLQGTLRLSTGFAALALQTGAAVVPMFCARDGRGYRLILEEPFHVRGETQVAIGEATARLGTLCEKYFRLYPEQWQFLNRLEMTALDAGGWQLVKPSPKTDKYYDMDNYLEK